MSAENQVRPGRLLLIRHGQTGGNVTRTLTGPESRDESLDDIGHQQARRLAQALATANPASPRLYASSYLRAQQTATYISDALGVPLNVLDGIHEIDVGHWVGRPYSHKQTFVHELTALDGQCGYPGGESLVGVGERCMAALRSVWPSAGETVLVVSHGAALVAMLARLLNLDPREIWLADSHRHLNTAFTELIIGGVQPPMVVRLADTSHMT